MKNSKKTKKSKKEPLTRKILTYLGKTSKDLLNISITILFDPRETMKGMGIYTQDHPLYYSPKDISNLKKSPYFDFKNNKFCLTRKGRIEIVRNVIKEKRNKRMKWDGKWRAISFDIPELNRRERAFLRNELRWIGFKELQKSIWIFPYDIEKELLALLKLWKTDFKGDIRFLRIEKIIKDKDIKKYFQV